MIVRILGYLGNAKKKSILCEFLFFYGYSNIRIVQTLGKGERELQYGELSTSLINRFGETVSR